MNLLTRIFLVLLAAALLPLAAAGVWFLRSSVQVEANARRLHEQIAALSADTLEKAAQDANRAFGFVMDIERNRPSDNARKCRLQGLECGRRSEAGDFRILQQAAATHPEFMLLALLDASGRETVKLADRALFPEPERLDRSKDPLVMRARSTGRLSMDPPEVRSGAALLRLAYPLQGGACLYAAYSLQPLWKRLQGLKIGGSGRVVVLAEDGAPLAGIAGDFLPRDWRLPAAASGQVGWLDSIRVSGAAYVGAWAAAPSFGWRALTLQPRSAALALSGGFKLRAALFLLALTLLVVLMAYWLAGQLTRPLNSMVDAARRVSANDFAKPVPRLGWGELEELGSSFNEMMKTLKAYQDLQVERRLDEKAKVDALIHAIPDGIALAGFDGSIAFINDSARAILGISGAAPSAKAVKEVFRVPELAEAVASLMSRRKRSAGAEFELRPPGARPRFFLCQAVTVMRERREIGILILLRDVTGERELARMKEDFFHSIVHDLRGPIGTIDGFVHLIKRQGGLGEKAQTFLDHVKTSSNKLRDLVADILAAAKIESGQLQLKRQPVSPEKLLSGVRVIYGLQARHAGIELRIEPGPEPPEPLSCDRELVERVLMNLVGNAMKFTPSKGALTVRCACIGAEEEFSVADTGPGIPEDKLEAVFEKFRQLDHGPAPRSGYGLGLAICRQVVALHGGRIWAESKPGQGSRFVFRLPFKAA
ncbi:MAG: HAMP domain-containing protein [Elusimicrobia bacterium]|nr:HAMP domain-containing protein [Elusimicrobiota bacterium]